MTIPVQIPEDQDDTPGVIFSSLTDENGQPYREADGRIKLYER